MQSRRLSSRLVSARIPQSAQLESKLSDTFVTISSAHSWSCSWPTHLAECALAARRSQTLIESAVCLRQLQSNYNDSTNRFKEAGQHKRTMLIFSAQ